MKIVRALPEDAAALTKVALAAKGHWGYPREWMRRWEGALTVTPEYIAANPTYAAVVDEEIVGFCALQVRSAEALLDHLWVLPVAMRKGVGRALFTHAEKIAREHGVVSLKIVGDPHAEGFYLRMGASLHGREDATINGQPRFLLLLEKAL